MTIHPHLDLRVPDDGTPVSVIRRGEALEALMLAERAELLDLLGAIANRPMDEPHSVTEAKQRAVRAWLRGE